MSPPENPACPAVPRQNRPATGTRRSRPFAAGRQPAGRDKSRKAAPRKTGARLRLAMVWPITCGKFIAAMGQRRCKFEERGTSDLKSMASSLKVRCSLAPRHHRRSADFQVCCIAGFQTRKRCDSKHLADLEVGDTAGLETCATSPRGWLIGGSVRLCPALAV